MTGWRLSNPLQLNRFPSIHPFRLFCYISPLSYEIVTDLSSVKSLLLLLFHFASLKSTLLPLSLLQAAAAMSLYPGLEMPYSHGK